MTMEVEAFALRRTIYWYIDKNVWRSMPQHVIAFLKLLRNAKLSDAKRSTWDASSCFSSHETSFVLWCSEYYDRRKDISLWWAPCSFLYMSLDASFAAWKKKEKKRIAIAGRFALVRQHTQTAITKMVHKRGPVPARQGTRQGFYREGPKSLPLSRVETPK